MIQLGRSTVLIYGSGIPGEVYEFHIERQGSEAQLRIVATETVLIDKDLDDTAPARLVVHEQLAAPLQGPE